MFQAHSPQPHAPGALTPSPTHTVYSAHQEPTTQWRTGHYPSTTNTTGPQGGGGDRGANDTTTTDGTGTRPHPITTY